VSSDGSVTRAHRSVGVRATLLLAYGLALLLPPSSPYAAVALPGLAGEVLSRWGLRRRPRVAVLIGALLVWGYVALLTLLVSLCGLSDEAHGPCDPAAAGPLALAFGSLAVVLAVIACALPVRRLPRYALWATPALMLVTVLLIGAL
jgi:hypothetical protein